MALTEPSLQTRNWTAAELRRLPREQQDAILAVAAAAAENDYRRDSDLTAFEAFGEEDLHGESSDSQPR
ncbi:MAG TPA: hypothetical protein VL371_05050 [Gemmataceae bacterium]|jgi:hypothetical protein|nr:hypothetical protein [Gemmataceae bacterium]